MRAGIIGYPYSGKTTLFQAACGGRFSGDLASVPVRDTRFDKLCAAVKPKKRTPATVELQDDAAPLPMDGKSKSGMFAEAARRFDVLIHVVREFESPTAPFHDTINPTRDHQAVLVDLVIADLNLVENRLEKLSKSTDAKSPGKREYHEKITFERVRPMLEGGTAIRNMPLSCDELEMLESYRLLTSKPLVVAINCSEDQISRQSDLEARLADQGEPVFRLCAAVEREIASLPEEERRPFLDDLGIGRPASETLIQTVYQALGLITFFTAGQNDTRAWPLRRGSTAIKAAAAVHTDIARGFIRAEVVHYADFDRLNSLKACYDQNLMRLEGKDYLVADGDILNIRNKT